MCSCGFLTWFWCLRLRHGPFFAPLVKFKSCHTGAYSQFFYLVGGVIHFLFVGVFWCHTRAYPISFVMIDGFDFSLIWVIYWHFLDTTLGHTPLFHGAITFHFLSFRWLFGIVSSFLLSFPVSRPNFLCFLQHRAWILYLSRKRVRFSPIFFGTVSRFL